MYMANKLTRVAFLVTGLREKKKVSVRIKTYDLLIYKLLVRRIYKVLFGVKKQVGKFQTMCAMFCRHIIW